MADQRLINYIKAQEAKGYTEEQLRDFLIKQGYNARDVDEAINSIKSKKVAAKTPVPVAKTHLVLYIITIIVSFILFTVIVGITPLLGSFSQSIFFVYISVISVSLIIGSITALILNKIIASNKLFLLCGSIVSFSSALLISISLSIMNILAEQLAQIGAVGSGMAVVQLFGAVPNQFVTAILMLLFFNLVFLILFFKKQEKSMKDLLVYLYGFIGYLALYFLISFFVVNQITRTII